MSFSTHTHEVLQTQELQNREMKMANSFSKLIPNIRREMSEQTCGETRTLFIVGYSAKQIFFEGL